MNWKRTAFALLAWCGLAVLALATDSPPPKLSTKLTLTYDLSTGRPDVLAVTRLHTGAGALVLSSATSLTTGRPAQFVQDTTPPPGGLVDVGWSLSGHKYATMSVPVYEVTFNFPFNMGFSAGHGLVWGTRLGDGDVAGDTLVGGWECYVRKEVGGDGFYLRASAGWLVGNGMSPDAAVRLQIGKRT